MRGKGGFQINFILWIYFLQGVLIGLFGGYLLRLLREKEASDG